MKKSLMLTLCALVATLASAQTKVVGTYADSITHKPVPFATVALRPDSAAMPEQVTLTGTDGRFELTTRRNGRYTLSIAQMGQRTVTVAVEAQGTKVDVGKLWAVEESEKLADVDVVAARPLVRSEVDRIAYEVESDPDAPVKTVFDMLRKTPLVTIDAQDNIKVNGQGNYTILVNERRSGMFSSDPVKVLKSIPAEAIKSIEVITEPGAKYEAEGVGCIINLVMSKKTTMKGIMGTLRGEYGSKQRQVGGHVMAQVGKLTLSANTGINKGKDYYDIAADVESLANGQTVSTYNHAMRSRSNSDGGHLYTEASFEIDTLRLLTLNVNYWKGNSRSYINDGKVGYSQAPSFESHLINTFDQRSHWQGYGIDLGYERKIGKKNTLVLLANMSQSPHNSGHSTSIYRPLSGFGVPPMMHDQSSQDQSRSLDYNLQVDFKHEFAPGRRLEVGAKNTWRDNSTDRSSANLECLTARPLYSDTSSVTQKQSIFSAYASYTINVGKWGVKAGLRSETAQFDTDNTAGLKQGSFKYSNSDIVPSLYLGYKFNPGQSLKLNYSMRIQRPSISYVDPMVTIDVMGNQQHGNPDIKSEHHHNVSLNFQRFSQKVIFTSNVSYNFCNNSIQSYQYTDKQTSINHSTYDNIGRLNNVNASVYARLTLGAKTSVTTSLQGQYTNIEARAMNEHAKGFAGTAYASLEQQLPLGIRSEWTGCLVSRQINLQNNTDGYRLLFCSLSRPFWEDRINVRLYCANPLKKNVHYVQDTWTEYQRMHMEAQIPYRSFNFSASIRLGKLKAQVRKTSSTITNDDLKTEEKQKPL